MAAQLYGPEDPSDDDESDVGWGEDLRAQPSEADDDARFLDDVPPHHGT